MSETCHHCGTASATTLQRCSRCKQAKYCGVACQKAAWRQHKLQCVPAAAAPGSPAPQPNVTAPRQTDLASIFPPDGMMQSYLFCMYCSHHFMLCTCRGLDHGEGMYFALPKQDDNVPFDDRIQRWATLIALHPLLQTFDATSFLADMEPNLSQKLQRTKPIILRLMEQYKTETLPGSHWVQTLDLQQIKSHCDIALALFYRGDWGQIKTVEWILLQNCVQAGCNPEDFKGKAKKDMDTFMTIVMSIMGLYKRVTQGHKCSLNFQMEDVA